MQAAQQKIRAINQVGIALRNGFSFQQAAPNLHADKEVVLQVREQHAALRVEEKVRTKYPVRVSGAIYDICRICRVFCQDSADGSMDGADASSRR